MKCHFTFKNNATINLQKTILFAIFSVTTLLVGCSKSDDQNNTAATEKQGVQAIEGDDSQIIRPVQVLQVSANLQKSKYKFNGIVKAGKESRLSFRVAGNVRNLSAKIGDYVGKGAHIADLDSTDYHVNMSQALANQKNIEASREVVYANIKQSEAELLRARSAYARAEKLYETDTIPVSEFEQARTAWKAAEASTEAAQLQFSSASAQVEAALQQVKSAKNQLTYTKLKAPFSGVISQVLVEENEQIGAGQPVVVLSNNRQTEIEVGVPASIIGSIKKGDIVTAQFFALPNRKFSGKITEVGFSTGNSSVYPVIIKLTDTGRSLRPGMTADVTFESTQNMNLNMVVPATAIGEDKDGKYVYTVSKHTAATTDKLGKKHPAIYKAHREPVTLGELTESGFVVNAGLQPGALIAKSGLNILQTGDLVTLFNDVEINKSVAEGEAKNNLSDVSKQ